MPSQAGQTVYHIVAATYNTKDIPEELMDLDCPLDAPDEDVSKLLIFWWEGINEPKQNKVSSLVIVATPIPLIPFRETQPYM